MRRSTTWRACRPNSPEGCDYRSLRDSSCSSHIGDWSRDIFASKAEVASRNPINSARYVYVVVLGSVLARVATGVSGRSAWGEINGDLLSGLRPGNT